VKAPAASSPGRSRLIITAAACHRRVPPGHRFTPTYADAVTSEEPELPSPVDRSDQVEDDAAPSTRRLILLRHAKSAWPDGVSDPDRPLADRGIADATAAGPILAALVTATATVLCSPALRTRQTWRLLARALTDPPPIRFEPVIYGAEVEELFDLIRSLPDDVTTALVIGHEPTMSQTAGALAGPGSDPAGLARLSTKYPTSGMAVFTLDQEWSALTARGARLERFVVPRG